MACTNIMNEWRSITIILKTPGWRSNLIAPSELIILAIAPLCIREQIGQCQGCRRPIKRKPKCERGPSFPSFVTPPIAKPQCLVNITATHVSRWEDNQFNKTFAAIIAFDSRGLLRFNKPPINGAHGEKYALPACGPAMRSGTGDGEKKQAALITAIIQRRDRFPPRSNCHSFYEQIQGWPPALAGGVRPQAQPCH